MTTDIRDGVVWKPWWVRYAEFEGRMLRLADADMMRDAGQHVGWRNGIERYTLGIGPEPCPFTCDDPTALHAADLWAGSDLDEALAAFHAAEERLLRGEL